MSTKSQKIAEKCSTQFPRTLSFFIILSNQQTLHLLVQIRLTGFIDIFFYTLLLIIWVVLKKHIQSRCDIFVSPLVELLFWARNWLSVLTKCPNVRVWWGKMRLIPLCIQNLSKDWERQRDSVALSKVNPLNSIYKAHWLTCYISFVKNLPYTK